SRAIVSEKLNYQAPGDFSPNRHYLEFEYPDRCVEQVGKLLSDADLRERIMRNNFEYYERYLRPDSMIRRTLNIALTSIP
ncbi:MAG TPA: glycosyltransferase, partial [Pyrinomonadaceae bacterium]|nr:glycosyltransferase [Pyrinomonadaceae bacterium]